ncbi:MAG TPA: SulP family inorganic anion transporter [Acidimicrobiia bacterium]|nr:SulP family inorganic anion transporter [Acidimicrobiia bacterium]
MTDRESRGPSAMSRWWASIRPGPGMLKKEAVAGLPGAIGSVPDGMASAVLTGVNPVYGLYASFAGPVAGGLSASTRLMVITTTTASALAAGSALASVDAEDKASTLFLLVVMAGAFMILAGIFKLGRYTRFVSHSVMIGFLTGVAVNILFGQIPDLTGAEAEGGSSLAKGLDVLLHPGSIDPASLLTGLCAIALLVILGRTRLAPYASVIALMVPTILVLNIEGIARVEDVGQIPQGFPIPALPELGLNTVDLIAAALAIAAIVLVQGAGVAESAPNRDGSTSDADRDFIAQGAGNVASGLFKGLPVGGSVGQTALNVSAGANDRWASIFSGLWMLVILVVLSGVVGLVAMPTLAAVLMVAAAGSLRMGQIQNILRTSPNSRIALISTFVATLFFPIPAAVGVGVVLSLMLQLNQEAIDLRVAEWVPQPDGGFMERPAPAFLPSHQVTILDAYGSLFYAGARTLQARLPEVGGAVAPAVVIRLRGRMMLGATAFKVFTDYADRLNSVEGKLYLSGVDPQLMRQFHSAGHFTSQGPIQLVEATSQLGESTLAALHDAETWLMERSPDEPEG